MKAFITILLVVYFSTTVCSQSKDTTISFISDQTNISYLPVDLVSNFSYSILKFKNGQSGIEFSLVTKRREPPPSIRLDSIILKSSFGKILVLNTPKFDTVYYRSDGGLFLMTIHWLDKVKEVYLETESIESIILAIDKKALVLKLTKKSQQELTEIADRLF